MALGILLTAGCSGAEWPPDSTDLSADPDASQGDGSSRKVCDYSDPPRCGPRGCVAMCVSCYYDRCRVAGRSCADCKDEMELCKTWCAAPPY